MVSIFAGIRQRLGFNYKKRGRFLTHRLELEGYENRHVIEYYLDLLKFLSIEPKSKNLSLFVPEINKARSRGILRRAGFADKDLVIGIAAGAGASWGKDAALKHWPASRFAQLADRLSNELGARIVVLGDGSERPISDVIVNSMRRKALDLTGKTTLEELIATIGVLNLLITNDGGPLHIAVAQGVKTVSIFGPVDPKVYGPYPFDASRHIVLKKNLDCSPCYRGFHLTQCERDRECLKLIDVQEAFASVCKLIKA
jgi:ADP-heptose:LPS heptosyltransferase